MQTSNGHPLDLNDNADQPRCPMEQLSGRFKGVKRPHWLLVIAWREWDGVPFCYMNLSGNIESPDQLDDIIAFLREVRG